MSRQPPQPPECYQKPQFTEHNRSLLFRRRYSRRGSLLPLRGKANIAGNDIRWHSLCAWYRPRGTQVVVVLRAQFWRN
jgi:hypothetical protein